MAKGLAATEAGSSGTLLCRTTLGSGKKNFGTAKAGAAAAAGGGVDAVAALSLKVNLNPVRDEAARAAGSAEGIPAAA